MKFQIRNMCALVVLVSWIAIARADTPSVTVTYDSGRVTTGELKVGASVFCNYVGGPGPVFTYIPAQVAGLQLGQVTSGADSLVTIHASAGSTVYVMVDQYQNQQNPLSQYLTQQGWKGGQTVRTTFGSVKRTYMLMRQDFVNDADIRLDQRPGWSGYLVAAANLTVRQNATAVPIRTNNNNTGSGLRNTNIAVPATAPANIYPDPPLTLQKAVGPSTKPARMQAAIRTLAVNRQASGLLLGISSDVVLTLKRGESPTEVNFRFVTPVGPHMRSSKEDALRYVQVNYPNWDVSGADLTFEDRDSPKDGGSIGAALTTLVLSTIEGFKIDRNVGVTGDISASGRVMPIGGVYAKVRGAEDAKCHLVALPADNFDRFLNTETFIGKGEVPQVQVIGVETIDDMVATVRTDRDAKLSEAIEQYDQVQQNISRSKGYLHSPECAEKLTHILSLCPQHFSAKLMLMEATGKRPKTLSEGASLYYLSVAVNEIMPTLAERAREHTQMPASSTVHQGLEELDKLRPMCDSNVVPLLDAWQRYIRTLSFVQSGSASSINLPTQAQAIRDAMAKLRMDPDSMQKLLKEGV